MQFRLLHLFGLTLLAAVFFALIRLVGLELLLIPGLVLLLLPVWYFEKQLNHLPWLWEILAVVLLLALAALLWPAVQ